MDARSFLLGLVDLAVNVAGLHQFRVGALGRYPTLVHHQDQVRVHHGGHPLGNNDLGGIFQFTRKGGGLAIASKYLALANGRIWIDTTYKGGACYYFSIPTEKL